MTGLWVSIFYQPCSLSWFVLIETMILGCNRECWFLKKTNHGHVKISAKYPCCSLFATQLRQLALELVHILVWWSPLGLDQASLLSYRKITSACLGDYTFHSGKTVPLPCCSECFYNSWRYANVQGWSDSTIPPLCKALTGFLIPSLSFLLSVVWHKN